MRKTLLYCICILSNTLLNSQPENTYNNIYRASATKTFDLIHTKLDVRFDYLKKRMPAKAWITLRPHFYSQDSLVLDAKGMTINKVAIVKNGSMKNMDFDYSDSLTLKIKLDKQYKRNEQLTLYIDYIAKPDEMLFKGSAAIRNAKGLYFINADGKDSTKPVQIWTQGETEANSVWFPTIDKPNQKTTEEIYMTVPARYVTLSNGILKSSKKNSDGTRTDYWKMDLPHAPYLFFMGVGDLSIIKDKYKNIPVDYYVEPKYANVARKIFGLTPEMIGFFSKLLGVEYPWPKYAQMVGRDYVSGAMENTTATLHGSMAYQKSRSLVDGNEWESTIAHELFHQWFGDYVTTESWSNITLNESFANYSQTLWFEYKYGKDAGDEENYRDMQKYFSSKSNAFKQLVRFYYTDKEEVFDQVSYEKGGRILNMLRNYLGDSAFFKGLNLYLNSNKFKAAEAHQLRLAMEEISGKDLNWFFNQWYYNIGHPEVDINYEWLSTSKEIKVSIRQKQLLPVFQFPLNIDVYIHSGKKRYNVWVKDTVENFYFKTDETPELVNVDGDKVMLWKKNDHKVAIQYMYQFKNCPLFMDRKEALDYIIEHFDSSQAQHQFLVNALKDPYYSIRDIALRFWRNKPFLLTPQEEILIGEIAQHDSHQPTRAIAIDILRERKNKSYESLFRKSCTDSSYSVAGAALEALVSINPEVALKLEDQLDEDADERLYASINILKYMKLEDSKADSLISNYKKMSLDEKYNHVKAMCYFADKQTDISKFKRTIAPIIEVYTNKSSGFRGDEIKETAWDGISWLLDKKEAEFSKEPDNKILQQQIKYIKEKLKS